MRQYAAKLLLFGEYTIVLGSKALAVPYRKYVGEWDFDSNNDKKTEFSRAALSTFSQYLKTMKYGGLIEADYDMERFSSDLQNGIYFKSNIPHGYGAGSSGALVAAVYDRYFYHEEPEIPGYAQLKKLFARLESHFHGESSGVDPLVSYLDRPLLLEPAGSAKVVNIPEINRPDSGIFLIDTGITRKTGPLVNYFLQACKEESFSNIIRKNLMPQNELAIQSYLKGDQKRLLDAASQISALQYLHFSKMIPENFRKIWKSGMDSGLFSLKLCGAGGGGYILGFTSDYENLPEAILNLVSDKL